MIQLPLYCYSVDNVNSMTRRYLPSYCGDELRLCDYLLDFFGRDFPIEDKTDRRRVLTHCLHTMGWAIGLEANRPANGEASHAEQYLADPRMTRLLNVCRNEKVYIPYAGRCANAVRRAAASCICWSSRTPGSISGGIGWATGCIPWPPGRRRRCSCEPAAFGKTDRTNNGAAAVCRQEERNHEAWNHAAVLFPYIGYWQLMNAVDRYVIYDDVNFIKGGWINRNRILMGSEVKYFNLPMQGASPFKKINEVGVQPPEQWVKGSLDKLRLAYRKAPCYGQAMPLAEDILTCGSTNLAEFLAYSIRAVAAYLEMNTEFVISSTLKKDNALHGQDKGCWPSAKNWRPRSITTPSAASSCIQRGLCPAGHSAELLDTRSIRYVQGSGEFQPNLSILDVLMYNPKEQVQEMLREYDLR